MYGALGPARQPVDQHRRRPRALPARRGRLQHHQPVAIGQGHLMGRGGQPCPATASISRRSSARGRPVATGGARTEEAPAIRQSHRSSRPHPARSVRPGWSAIWPIIAGLAIGVTGRTGSPAVEQFPEWEELRGGRRQSGGVGKGAASRPVAEPVGGAALAEQRPIIQGRRMQHRLYPIWLRRLQENNSSAEILYNTYLPMAGGRHHGTEPFDVLVARGDCRFLPRCPPPTVHGPDGRGFRPQPTTSGPPLGLGRDTLRKAQHEALRHHLPRRLLGPRPQAGRVPSAPPCSTTSGPSPRTTARPTRPSRPPGCIAG